MIRNGTSAERTGPRPTGGDDLSPPQNHKSATERWHLPEPSRVGPVVNQLRLLSFLRFPFPADSQPRLGSLLCVSAWWFWLQRDVVTQLTVAPCRLGIRGYERQSSDAS